MRLKIMFLVITTVISFLSLALLPSNNAFAYLVPPGCETIITCRYPNADASCVSGARWITGTGCIGDGCDGCVWSDACSTPSDCTAPPLASCTVSTRVEGTAIYLVVNWADINPGDGYTYQLDSTPLGGSKITVHPLDWSRLHTAPSDDIIDPVLTYGGPLNLEAYKGSTLDLALYRVVGGVVSGACTKTITLGAAACGGCTYSEPVDTSVCASGFMDFKGAYDSSGVCVFVPGCTLVPGECAGGGGGAPGKNPCAPGFCNTAIGNIPTEPLKFAGAILGIGIGLAGGIALILMVIGSVKVLTSSGDQQKLNSGRDMIVAAVSGLLFLIFSILILRFIGFSIIGLG